VDNSQVIYDSDLEALILRYLISNPSATEEHQEWEIN